jgi:hypothetical protein
MNDKSEENTNSREGILKQLTSGLPFLGLIVLIIESLLLTVLISGDFSAQKKFILILIGLVVFILFGITVIFICIKYPQFVNPTIKLVDIKDVDLYLEKLETRRDLYIKAKKMISESKNFILDTTWGISPLCTTDSERKAREDYRKEVEKAIQRGIHYSDLYSVTKVQLEELKRTVARYKAHPQYQGKYIDLIKEDCPAIDFLITNKEEMILSHVSYPDKIAVPVFLYVKSQELTAFFSAYFNECWKRSSGLT